MSELFDPGVPPYPCVALVGSGKSITYDKRGKNDEGKPIEEGRAEGERSEVRYFPVSSIGDLEHIGHMRRFKRWGVRSHHNLEKLKLNAANKEQLINELDLLVTPPEMAPTMPKKAEKKTHAAA